MSIIHKIGMKFTYTIFVVKKAVLFNQQDKYLILCEKDRTEVKFYLRHTKLYSTIIRFQHLDYTYEQKIF